MNLESLGTWWDDDFPFRVSVMLDGSFSGANRDGEISIPTDWDEFWDNVGDTTNGYDIVIVDPGTNQPATFQLQSFTFANRDCVIELDGLAVQYEARHFWLYWGYASATDASTTFTPAGTIQNGYVELGGPARADLYVTAGADAVGSQPPYELVKHSAEDATIWVDFGPLLRTRLRAHNGSKGFETIDYASYEVEDAGTPAPSLKNDAGIRILAGRLVGFPITGGTAGTDYTATLAISTTLGRVLNETVLVTVQDLADS